MSCYALFQKYNSLFYAIVPANPKYGNYRLRGKNNRYRKTLKNE